MRPGVRQSSMQGFYGERVCRRRNQPCSLVFGQLVGSSTSATFVLPVRHGTCVAVQTKRMEDRHVMWSNDQAEAGAKISK